MDFSLVRDCFRITSGQGFQDGPRASFYSPCVQGCLQCCSQHQADYLLSSGIGRRVRVHPRIREFAASFRR